MFVKLEPLYSRRGDIGAERTNSMVTAAKTGGEVSVRAENLTDTTVVPYVRAKRTSGMKVKSADNPKAVMAW